MTEKMNAVERTGLTQEAPPAKQRRPRRERKPSPLFMTVQEVADLLCVSESSVLQGRGRCAELRRAPVTDRRIVFVRREVEQLARQIERGAVSLGGKVSDIGERRRAS